MRLAKKLGIRGFAKSSHASMFVIGRYEVAPQTQLFGYRQPLRSILKNKTKSFNLDKYFVKDKLSLSLINSDFGGW